MTRSLARLGSAAALAIALLVATRAHASGDGSPRWLSLGVLGGATALDPSLADFRWDVEPRVAWGAQALAGRGPFALGARVTRASTTQRLAVDGGPLPAAVRLTHAELVGRARLATLGGAALALTASGGRVHVGYHPDRVVLPAAVAGSDVEVALAPLDAWTWGGGLAAGHALAGPWWLGLALERRAYGWDAARHTGDAVVVGRESFGEWNAQVELAWTAGRR